MDSGSARTMTRRAVMVAALSGICAGVAAVSWDAGVQVGRSASTSSAPPAARVRVRSAALVVPSPPQLPRGGRHLFPAYRLIGFSGGPGSAAFGRLGIGNIDARVREIESLGV